MLHQTLLNLIKTNKFSLIDKLQSNIHEMNLTFSNYYFDLDTFKLLQMYNLRVTEPY